MKNLITLFIVFVLSFNSYSQSYIPFPDSGAVWVNALYNTDMGEIMFSTYTNFCVNGNDTIINTNTYTKLEICLNHQYRGALRDDNGKVYYVPIDSTNEFLLYDFTVEAGDIIPEVWGVDLMGSSNSLGTNINVISVSSILIGGITRKKIVLDVLYGDGSYWIEGIGCTNGLLRGLNNNSNISDAFFDLECMSLNDTTYYPNYVQKKCFMGLAIEEKEEINVEVYPNPTREGIVKISFTNIHEPTNYFITNLNGQVVSEGIILNQEIELDLSAGFYLLNINNQKFHLVKKIIVY